MVVILEKTIKYTNNKFPLRENNKKPYRPSIRIYHNCL